MGKIIIGIHGLGNKPPKKMLESWWKLSILEGLKATGKQSPKINFKLVYWADIVHEKPLDISIADKESPLFLDEIYTTVSPDFISKPIGEKEKKLHDFLKKELGRVFLNDDYTLNFSFITDAIIHNYFQDLEIYYSDRNITYNNQQNTAKNLIRKRLADLLYKHKNDEIFLISHSMGTIIAYDVLTLLCPEIKINTFVTIGSPLGFPVVKSKIAAELKQNNVKIPVLKTPPGISNHWYNFADLEDKVALNYDLADEFEANEQGVIPEDFLVTNNYVMKGKKNPHKSFGYLRTPEFSDVLYQFLTTPGPNLFKRLFNWFRK
ncbi:MAG: hypothetical protein GXO79_12270 [Chlorobi bacterium]|nr:hypothetical protein [Chlorobiota bacterium]